MENAATSKGGGWNS